MRFRGIRAVLAMARPKHSDRERDALLAAMAIMPPGLSARSRANSLARRVVAEMVAASSREDPFEIALAEVARLATADPIATLADILAPALSRERVKRFEARGCHQLAPAAWDAETRDISEALVKHLTERFRMTARKRVKTSFSPNQTGQA